MQREGWSKLIEPTTQAGPHPTSASALPHLCVHAQCLLAYPELIGKACTWLEFYQTYTNTLLQPRSWIGLILPLKPWPIVSASIGQSGGDPELVLPSVYGVLPPSRLQAIFKVWLPNWQIYQSEWGHGLVGQHNFCLPVIKVVDNWLAVMPIMAVEISPICWENGFKDVFVDAVWVPLSPSLNLRPWPPHWRQSLRGAPLEAMGPESTSSNFIF